MSDIQVEDLQEVRVGGSFKRTFSTTAGEISKNFFRVFEGEGLGYTLSVQSGTKKQWIDSILNAKKALSAKKMMSPRSLPLLPCPEVNGFDNVESDPITSEDDVRVPVDDVRVPVTPTAPASPPLEFITPQAKPPLSRTTFDYTPTLEGGKKLRKMSNDQICVTPSAKFRTPACVTPSAKLCTPASKISNPGTPTATSSADQENCRDVANQMTPFSATSPKLMLRTDEHVLRLIVDDAPPASPSLAKTSIV